MCTQGTVHRVHAHTCLYTYLNWVGLFALESLSSGKDPPAAPLTAQHWNFGEERQQMGCCVCSTVCLSLHMVPLKADQIHASLLSTFIVPRKVLLARVLPAQCTQGSKVTLQMELLKAGPPKRPGVWERTRQRATAGTPPGNSSPWQPTTLRPCIWPSWWDHWVCVLGGLIDFSALLTVACTEWEDTPCCPESCFSAYWGYPVI